MNDDFQISWDRLYLTSNILGGVRHAVSSRMLSRDVTDRTALAIRLRDTMHWGALPIAMVEQVHGTKVAVIGASAANELKRNETMTFAEADALVTNVSGMMLGIFTADCVPILFVDEEAGVIGAVHAGWRGSIGRILQNALNEAFALGAQESRVKAWIGPAISGEEYEVSEELAARFAEAFPQWPIVSGRQVDLPLLNQLQALELGLREENVAQSGLCTKKRVDLLCSYRVDGDCAGRMVSGICM